MQESDGELSTNRKLDETVCVKAHLQIQMITVRNEQWIAEIEEYMTCKYYDSKLLCVLMNLGMTLKVTGGLRFLCYQIQY